MLIQTHGLMSLYSKLFLKIDGHAHLYHSHSGSKHTLSCLYAHKNFCVHLEESFIK